MPTFRVEFTAPVWVYPGGGWHFVTLPKEVAEEVRAGAGRPAGWGSLRVEAKILDVTWTTSIFPSKPTGSFVLPLQAQVRKATAIHEGSQVTVQLAFQV